MQLKITRTLGSTVSSQYYLQSIMFSPEASVVCTEYIIHKEQTNTPEKEVGNETPPDKQELRLPGSGVCTIAPL